MTKIKEKYQLLETIHYSQNRYVSRALNLETNQKVIIKTWNKDFNSRIQKVKKEYDILKKLAGEGVVEVHELLIEEAQFSIVMEDFEAVDLASYLKNNSIPFEEVIAIALKVAKAIGHIHQNNVIHKDINPSNIVYNAREQIIKLIDFGIASEYSFETAQPLNPNNLEGTLPYISPEQTGRMNRPIDYRTDFYSLGITLYELLTGHPPFQTADTMEMVHFHIAKTPLPVYEINTAIPKIVSDIIGKLLEKNAETRYQSAFGIIHDLELCLQDIDQIYSCTFPLAQNDIGTRFQIPQKLYGRESEIQTLLQAFEKNNEGDGQMIMIGGYSGIGKTALVKEIYKPITAKKGYFISGKFGQFQRNTPYSAIVAAITDLIEQLLVEPDATLNQWREKLLEALGANGQVVIDVIPEMELIIGKQAPVTVLSATESRNRFNIVFQDLFHVFSSKEHPIVLFLDDLQWADSATLKLIELIMTDKDMKYLFVIGAYRNNEVDATHPFMMLLEELKNNDIIIHQLELTPLKLEYIEQLVADTLHSTTENVKPLAALIEAKTGGNPFFVNEFLKNLYAENLIQFTVLNCTPENGMSPWKWDIEKIKAKGITDNVVDLLVSNLKKLPISLQRILELAACVGAEFDLRTLSIIAEQSEKELFYELTPALQSGLILPLTQLNDDLLITDFKFSHDRVQQASYSMIADALKKEIHLRIGKLLLVHIEEKEEGLFDIVNQLNSGKELIVKAQEREALAKLNLKAGKKARNSNAYIAATQYLQTGIELLTADCWKKQYELTVNLYEAATEAAYLSSNYEQLEQLAAIFLSKTTSLVEKIRIYEIQIIVAISRSQLKEAIQIGRELLQLLGVEFPAQPAPADIGQALEQTFKAWHNLSIPSLLNAPEMTDPIKLTTMRILTLMVAPCYRANPLLLPLVIFKQTELTIAEGNCAISAFSYADYGLLLSGIVGDIDAGYQFGRLALDILDRFQATAGKCRTYFIVHSHISHWKEPLRKQLPLLLEGYEAGLETGDLEHCALNVQTYCAYAYFSGCELSALSKEMELYRQVILQLKHEPTYHYHVTYQQAVLNLLGESPDPCKLVGEIYDEEHYLPMLLETDNGSALYNLYYNKTVLCYLFCDYKQAAENAALVEFYANRMAGMFAIALFEFYNALISLAVYPHADATEQKRLMEKVEGHLVKLKNWSSHAPENQLNKLCLVEAEKYRVLGDHANAIAMYDRAIELSKENQFLNDEALANELAAKFYFEWGKPKIARVYMIEAHYLYQQWGATGKVKYLEQKFPALLYQTKGNASSSISTTDTTANITLDFGSVTKASQVISGEIIWDKLLSSLMKILVENAGATRGFLLLTQSEKLSIEASWDSNTNQASVFESVLSDDSDLLSPSIVNYVSRTKQDIIFENAADEGKFKDNYIIKNKPKSVLCIPLLKHGRLVGIVYLENNIATGAFTKDRIEVLKMLSSQAAISIENAKLYDNLELLNENLEKIVEKRTAEIQEKNVQLVELNGTKDKFFSIIAHDLRGPFTGFLGLTELIVGGIENLSKDEILEYTKLMNTSANNLFKLLENLLEWAKMQKGVTKFNPERSLLFPMVKTNIDLIAEFAGQKNIELVNVVPVTSVVFADTQMLNAIVRNFISNALKFTPKGGKVEIGSIDEYENGKSICIYVKDNGIGMSQESIDKLFKIDQKVSRLGTNGELSSGLGLFLCKEFIEKHGGRIWVESEVNKGSTFKFTIPKIFAQTVPSTNQITVAA